MVYYNEWDSFAADWLEGLIAENLIAPGIVDRRSITEVQPNDLKGFKQWHFFAGIGGWSRALRLAGWGDDRSICTASLPCQPFSTAGANRGKSDERHLLPHFMQLVEECKFDVIAGEQVEGAVRHGWLDDLYAEMEAKEYAVGSVVLGAHSVGAAHQRQRIYWFADRIGMADTASEGLERDLHRSGAFGGSNEQERGGPLRTAGGSVCGERASAERLGDTESERRGETREYIERSSQRSTGASAGINDAQRLADAELYGRNEGLQPLSGGESERSRGDSVDDRNLSLGDTRFEGSQIDGRPRELHFRESDGANPNGLRPDSSVSDSALGDTASGGLSPRGGSQRIERQGGESRQERDEIRGDAGNASDPNRALGDTDRDGSGRHSGATPSAQTESERGRESDRGLPNRPRVASESGRGIDWREFDFVYCRDEKVRPIPQIKPGVLALVDGLSDKLVRCGDEALIPLLSAYPLTDLKIPNRPGILKGAGNAIVPQTAAAVISAFMEIKGEGY